MPNPIGNTQWTEREQYQIKAFLPEKKFGILPNIDNYDESKELLKRINDKLDRLLSTQDYTLKNGIWVKP